jgi:hypothetical protein
MTIETVISRVVYTASSAQTEFPFAYKFLENADLLVYVDDDLQTSGYTVTGAGLDAGGEVTFAVGLTAGQVVAISRAPAITQEVDYVENDPFPAETHEGALDKLTMVCQRLEDGVLRAVKLGVGSSLSDIALAEPEANKALVWNSGGTGIENGPTTTEISNAQTYATNASASASAAITAQGLAEDARDAAQGYASSASDDADTASAGAAVITTNLTAINNITTNLAAIQGASANAATATAKAGEASGSAALASEWAINPENDPITGYPGEYSARHWAAKAAAAASGGAVKASADDTTPGYLEDKLALASNSGLVLATLNPGGNEVRTIAADFGSTAGKVTQGNDARLSDTRTPTDNSVGLDQLTHGTAGNLYTFASNGAPAFVATGTAGQVLKSAGAGQPPAFGDASGGMWEYVRTDTASNNATVDFTGLAPATYDYMIVISSLAPVTDNTDLYLRLGFGGTPTYSAQVYWYSGMNIPFAGTHAEFVGANTTQYLVGRYFGNGYSAQRVEIIIAASAANHAMGNARGVTEDHTFTSGFINLDTGPFTAIRLYMSAGNIGGGTFELYRRTKN